LAPKS